MKQLLALTLCGGLLLALADAAPVTKTLPAFSTVTLCTPYNVLVTPGSDYAVVIDAEDQVQKAISPNVSVDTLFLEVMPCSASPLEQLPANGRI
jgi:hypothetical protein